MKHLLITICILSIIPGVLWALDPGKAIYQYRYDAWKSERGLPVEFVFRMVQDRDGYIWLGTSNGLIRFDGVRFTLIEHNATPEFSNNMVRALYKEPNGILWIGTDNGLYKYENSGFTYFSTQHGLPQRIVYSILRDSNGVLWVGTRDGGLAALKDGSFTTYTTREGLAGNVVTAILEDSNGILRVATKSGLSRLVDGRFVTDPIQEKLKPRNLTSLLEDRNKNLWIGAVGGLYKISGETLSFYSNQNGLNHDIVLTLTEDRDGNVWVGTDNGLNRFAQNGTVSSFLGENSLNRSIYSIIEDHEGSLWLGSQSGLVRLADVSVTTFSTDGGLSNNEARCVVQETGGDLWVGTAQGLNRLRNDRFQVYTSADGMIDEQIGSLLAEPDGSLWIGTSNGVQRIDTAKLSENNTFKRAVTATYTPSDGLGGKMISAIIKGRNGTYWFGSYDNGLSRLKDNKFSIFNKQNGLSHDRVTCLLEDDGGNIWIGTQSGLNCLKADNLTQYTTAEGLSHNYISSLYQDKDGVIWIGTDNGPTRLKDGVLTAFYKKEKRLRDEVLSIVEDQQGYFWMSSHKGILRVSVFELNQLADEKNDSITITLFNKADGMKSQVCNGGTQPAGYMDREGKIWFPSAKGVVMVDPANTKLNPEAPPIQLEQVLVNGEPVDVVFNDTGVTFPAGSREMEFHYTGLSFLKPENVRFRFRLEGYETEWVEAGSRREAYYTNLSPGAYTFMFNACNDAGIWNKEPVSYRFYLAPYFYQTTWFYLICGFCVLGVAFFVYRWRIGKLERMKNELERLVAERTRQLKVTNSKLSNANLELKKMASLDTLTGIHNYRWFSEFFGLEWRRSFRNGGSLTLIIIDVDCFKAYNETYGHPEGDDVLKRIGQKLKEMCRRPGDVVARYGGEEFIALFADTSMNEAPLVAERLRKGIIDMKIPNENSTVSPYLTISLGCATTAPKREEQSGQLIADATKALTEAKNAGRNCYVTLKTETED